MRADGAASLAAAPTGSSRALSWYDPSTKTVTSAGDMVTAREAHTATLLPNGKVLIVGGGSPIPGAPDYWAETTSAELYDPATGTFTPTGSLAEGRAGHAAVLLADGRVLVAGGSDGFYSHATAELYDPGTGTFAVTGSMSVGRGGSPAVLRGAVPVFITGGFAGFETWATSERYGPATSQFSSHTVLPGPRSYHSLVGLPDGTLLLTGGVPAYGGASLTSSVAYDSGTRLFTRTADWRSAASRYLQCALPMAGSCLSGTGTRTIGQRRSTSRRTGVTSGPAPCG